MSNQRYICTSFWTRIVVALMLIGLLLPVNSALADNPAPESFGKYSGANDTQNQAKFPISRMASPFWSQRDTPLEALEGWEQTKTFTAGNLIQDPSFESFVTPSYDSPYWAEYDNVWNPHTPLCNGNLCGYWSDAHPYNGYAWAWFGGAQVPVHTASLSQTVTIPSCKARLQFYFWIGYAQPGSDAGDAFFAKIDGVTVFSANATQIGSYSTYKLINIDVSSFANGAAHTIQFSHKNTVQDVGFHLDDVSLKCISTVKGDYNGDGKKDIAVFRPSNSTWYIYGMGPSIYGTVDDIPVPADYNGDGKTDIAIFRPSNSTWYIYGVGPFTYGAAGDIPVVADYNGDGKADIAVFRPSNSTWYIYGVGPFTYGTTGDIPVVADYDGDGKADIAVFRPSNSTWYIYGVGPFTYGTTGDIPVVADYNGDGKADIAVFRPSNSTWYIYGVGPFTYGAVDDIPVVGDYNGDGKADIAVFRPSNSTWYIYGVGPFIYGTVGDIPV